MKMVTPQSRQRRTEAPTMYGQKSHDLPRRTDETLPFETQTQFQLLRRALLEEPLEEAWKPSRKPMPQQVGGKSKEKGIEISPSKRLVLQQKNATSTARSMRPLRRPLRRSKTQWPDKQAARTRAELAKKPETRKGKRLMFGFFLTKTRLEPLNPSIFSPVCRRENSRRRRQNKKCLQTENRTPQSNRKSEDDQ